MVDYPSVVPNWIGGRDAAAASGETFAKFCPADGKEMARVPRSRAPDVRIALDTALRAQQAWADKTPVQRGDILRAAVLLLKDRAPDISRCIARESGKSFRDALGETQAAIEMGFFISGEGRRFYGHTTTSAVPHKIASTVRQPVGIAGLIVPANTPLPNVAWKTFPALLCGNAAILKAAEDTPYAAWIFAHVLHEAGLPPGVFNVIQGLGEEAGAPLVEAAEVGVVSFTGSAEVGRWIGKTAGARLAKVCLELGGKNPLIVCDDADIGAAAQAAALSAFSNAGQRCASGSRLIVFEAVYDRFREALLARTRELKIGVGDEDDMGPVINGSQLDQMLRAISEARSRGARILSGGQRLSGPAHAGGYYLAPTVIENAPPDDPLSRQEIFGPVTCLYRARDFAHALELANDCPYGLTASIHTNNLHRAMEFQGKIRCGVAIVNGPTFGSEPHMPFGGLRQSGNGMREAGREALDVYSEWKTLYVNYRPGAV